MPSNWPRQCWHIQLRVLLGISWEQPWFGADVGWCVFLFIPDFTVFPLSLRSSSRACYEFLLVSWRMGCLGYPCRGPINPLGRLSQETQPPHTTWGVHTVVPCTWGQIHEAMTCFDFFFCQSDLAMTNLTPPSSYGNASNYMKIT